MLTNLLPGVRNLRAPLASGLLWLLLLWLWFGDALPSSAEAERGGGPLAQIYELEPLVSSIGVLALLTFVAFLVGSLAIGGTEWLAAKTWEWIEPAVVDVIRRLNLDPPGGASVGFTTRFGRRVTFFRLPGLSSAGAAEVERWFREYNISEGESQGDVLRYGTELVSEVLRSDRSRLKTELLSRSDVLHSEVDRPESEASLRLALVPPLTLILCDLAISDGALWLFGLAVPLALLLQGLALRREANDALITAMRVQPELGERYLEIFRRERGGAARQSAPSTQGEQPDARAPSEDPNAVVEASGWTEPEDARPATPTSSEEGT